MFPSIIFVLSFVHGVKKRVGSIEESILPGHFPHILEKSEVCSHQY